MSGPNKICRRGRVTTSDLSGSQHLIVRDDATNTVLAAAATSTLLGILEDGGVASGSIPLVCVSGVTECIAGGAVPAGAFVTADANARGVAMSPVAGANVNYAVGNAVTSAAADGDRFWINVSPSVVEVT